MFIIDSTETKPTADRTVAELYLEFKDGKKSGKDPDLEKWQCELEELSSYVLKLEEISQYDILMLAYYTNDERTAFRMTLVGTHSIVRNIVKTLYDAYNPTSSLRDRRYYVVDPTTESLTGKLLEFFKRGQT